YALVSNPVPGEAVLDSATGLFEWTPAEAQGPGSYQFTVEVTEVRSDEETPLSSSRSFTVNVQEINALPVLTLPALPAEIDELSLFEFTAQGADEDLPGNPLSFWLDDAPSGAQIDPHSGVFSWTPTERQGPGSYTFDVRLYDGRESSTQPVTVNVLELNQAPTLDEISDKTVQGQNTLSFWVYERDPDISGGDNQQSLTCRLEGDVPAGASITDYGYFTWTPTESQTPGTYTLDAVVSDGELEARRSFTIYAIERADLTVTRLDLPTNAPMEGAAVRLRARIDNIGSGDLLQNVYAGFYVNGSYIGYQWINSSSLPNGQYTWVERIWTAVPGTNTVEVRIDYQDYVEESSEGNNTLSQTLPEIIAPDIVVTNVSWLPQSINEGETVQFFFSVTNAGGTTARDVDVQLNVDGVWGDWARIRGPVSNQTESVTLEWTATPGPHEIEIVADRYGNISELNRSNNVAHISLASIEDTRAPSFTTLVPGDGQRLGGDAFALNIAATDTSGISGYRIEVSTDELFWTTLHEGAVGSASWDTTALADGEYAVRFNAWDTNGNTNQVTHTVTIDNSPLSAVSISADPIEFGTVVSWTKPTDGDYSFCRIF
ncbi:MAG TPA: CARDB domain-containing protein, partial [Tichowtungia sp.]|nr:CARDB domain-containing protein [Tichowtungia sp.]